MKHATDSEKPLVAVVASVPILYEGLSAALESIAEVHGFPAHQGDTAGLLKWLQPDAVVVDAEDEAEAAALFARESRSPLVYISLQEKKLRVLRDGAWEEAADSPSSPEEIRNILVGSMFGREVGHDHN